MRPILFALEFCFFLSGIFPIETWGDSPSLVATQRQSCANCYAFRRGYTQNYTWVVPVQGHATYETVVQLDGRSDLKFEVIQADGKEPLQAPQVQKEQQAPIQKEYQVSHGHGTGFREGFFGVGRRSERRAHGRGIARLAPRNWFRGVCH